MRSCCTTVATVQPIFPMQPFTSETYEPVSLTGGRLKKTARFPLQDSRSSGSLQRKLRLCWDKAPRLEVECGYAQILLGTGLLFDVRALERCKLLPWWLRGHFGENTGRDDGFEWG